MSVKRVEVVERSQMDTLPFLLLFCESWMFVKENPDRKEKTITLKNRFFSNIFNINIRNKFMIGISCSLYSHTIFLWCSEKQTSNKRRSKVQEKNMSCEHALNFDQWKTFSENYKPMRVWLWLVYKFTENYYPSRLFSEFIQTQKRYPTSLDKIRILTWKLLVISS